MCIPDSGELIFPAHNCASFLKMFQTAYRREMNRLFFCDCERSFKKRGEGFYPTLSQQNICGRGVDYPQDAGAEVTCLQDYRGSVSG